MQDVRHWGIKPVATKRTDVDRVWELREKETPYRNALRLSEFKQKRHPWSRSGLVEV